MAKEPLPIIERTEIVSEKAVETAVRYERPLLTDQYGDWFVLRYKVVTSNGIVMARLRLAVPNDYPPWAILAEPVPE